MVATKQQWALFEEAWLTKLLKPLPGKPPLKKFSMAQCRAHQGEFLDYSQAESDAVTHDFRQIIIDTELASTVSVVDREAWDELIVGKLREVLGDAEQPCFINCIDRSCEWAAEQPGDDRINLVFDRGRKSKPLEEVIKLYENNARFPMLSSIKFAEVAKTPPLQAADMVVTESFWYAQQWLENACTAAARAHFRNYIRNMRCEGQIIGRPDIEAEVRRRGSDGLAR
jgi:hypothetical protein